MSNSAVLASAGSSFHHDLCTIGEGGEGGEGRKRQRERGEE